MIRNQTCKQGHELFPKLRLLPNHYKTVGLAFAVLSFLILIALRYYPELREVLRPSVKNAMVLSLLLVAVSKDKIEDELTMTIRKQAFALAFIWGTILAVVQPYVTYLVAALIKEGGEPFEEWNTFVTLFTMLVIHLLYFEAFKRRR